MKDLFEEHFSQLIAIVFFSISVLSFRESLFSQKVIGLLHDWVYPIYPEQVPQYILGVFSAWNPAALGSDSFITDIPFKLIFGVISLPSITFGIKISLIMIQFFAGFFMYWLLRKYFKASHTASACAGLFYMLTPVIFTRVIVGYFYYLIGYALLPIIFITFFFSVKNRSIPYFLLCGVLYSFAAVQIQFAVIVPFLLLFFILTHRPYLKSSICSLCQLIILFCFIQLPLVVYYLSSILTHETSFNQLASSAQYFWLYFFPPQISDSLILFGKDYEFLFMQYFQNKLLFLPFLISALLLTTIAFSIFRKKKAFPFIILGIIVIVLMSGTSPPFGILYQWVYERIPLAGLFRTSYHWAVLLAFSYAILIGIAYDHITGFLIEKTDFLQWIKDFFVAAGCVFLIYVGYILSHIPTLTKSLQMRGIPAYFIYIWICISIIILVSLYLKSETIVSWILKISSLEKNYKPIICILFIGMILIYGWPFFTGNFSGRLQIYSYDQEYQNLFTKIQQDPRDFRILWLPMISPIQYDGYQYPGHDQLISYSPKESFPQDIAMFNPVAKYTSFLANLQYTQDTEYFGDIIDDFSTNYVISRNDFKPVLPDYLPFGSVAGFQWNNNQTNIFLEHQKDLTNINKNTHYTIWENNFTPRISVQIPVAVEGDLSTKIGLSYARAILGYDQIPALLYLEDTNTANYQDLAKIILFDGSRTDDLIFSFLNSSYLFDAGWYTKEIDARKDWTTSFNWWWYNTRMSAQPEYGAFTLNSSGILTVNPDLPSGNYSIFVKARSGPNSTNITYSINSTFGKISMPHDMDIYSWYSLGHYNLIHTNLTIQSCGQNEIERVAFVPDSELENSKYKVANFLSNRSVVMIYEPENYNISYAHQAFGTSRGYIEIPKESNVSFIISIPKETEYSGYLRIRSYNGSVANLTIDTTQLSVPIPPSDQYTWVPITNITLSKGQHAVSLRNTKTLDFDMFLLISTDYQYQPPNVTVTYKQKSFATWADPTQFSIKGNSKDPYFLVFNENYHPAWDLSNTSGYKFDHYKVNYYANGYYVNNSSNDTLELKFINQDEYFNSVIISLGSLIIIIILIISGLNYRKKIK